jgi:hypothetical protein
VVARLRSTRATVFEFNGNMMRIDTEYDKRVGAAVEDADVAFVRRADPSLVRDFRACR